MRLLAHMEEHSTMELGLLYFQQKNGSQKVLDKELLLNLLKQLVTHLW
jgi:hypothetical protein